MSQLLAALRDGLLPKLVSGEMSRHRSRWVGVGGWPSSLQGRGMGVRFGVAESGSTRRRPSFW